MLAQPLLDDLYPGGTALPWFTPRPSRRLRTGTLSRCPATPSNRKVRAHVVAVHRRARAAGHHFAAREHDVMVGERLGEIVILLDEQDRHFAARHQFADRALDVLDDRRLDSLRRLVED